jgi:hypothetical protein
MGRHFNCVVDPWRGPQVELAGKLLLNTPGLFTLRDQAGRRWPFGETLPCRIKEATDIRGGQIGRTTGSSEPLFSTAGLHTFEVPDDRPGCCAGSVRLKL